MKTYLKIGGLLLALSVHVHAADLNASGQTREEWDQAWTGKGYSFQEWDDLWAQSYQTVRQREEKDAAERAKWSERRRYMMVGLAVAYLARTLWKSKNQ
jgi:hypothetical protein